MGELLEDLRRAIRDHHDLDIRADLFTSAEYQRLRKALKEADTHG